MRKTLAALTIALGFLGAAGNAKADPPRPAAPQVHAPAHAPQAQAPHAPAAPQVQARPRVSPLKTPAQAKALLQEVAEHQGIPHFVNANGKVVYNTHSWDHLDAIAPLGGRETGVLELLVLENNPHTFGHFEGQYIHFQYVNGTSNWRLHKWADNLRPSDRRMFGAKIQLTEKEAANMRLRIAGIFAEEGPAELAGERWEHGHIKDSVGVRGFNCASAWCQMPIGENGESVATIVGIPATGYPAGLQRALETGNDRVFGIGLYGPKEENLGADPKRIWAR